MPAARHCRLLPAYIAAAFLDIGQMLRLVPGSGAGGGRVWFIAGVPELADVAALHQLIEPEVEAEGLALVRVKMIGGKSDPTLQVMAERPDTRQLTLDDCARLSRRLSERARRQADPIEDAYRLEVSSPGIDRPLTRLQDFEDWKGHEARIALAEPLDGRKQFRPGRCSASTATMIADRRARPGRDAAAVRQHPHAPSCCLTDKLIAATAPLSRGRAPRRRSNRWKDRTDTMATTAPTGPGAVSANKAELIAIADAVAREKLIDRAIVIEAMEDAIQRAARARYGAENDIRAKLDPTSGDLRLWRVVEVVEEVEDYFKQVSLEDAQKLQPGAALGDFIVDPLPPIEFGRIAAQAAKQVIFQKVRDAERERQYEEFKDRVGEIITGVVKRVEFGHVVVDLGRAEGVIRRDQQIPREVLRVGDRTRSLILNVRRENRGPQIFLSAARIPTS